MKNKNILIVFGLMLLAAFFGIAANQIATKDIKGDYTDVIPVLADQTVANSQSDTATLSILNYKKFTFYTTSNTNDSAKYIFKLLVGTAGTWTQVWNDTIISTTASKQIVGTDSKVFTWCQKADTTRLAHQLKWIRTEFSTGNGTTKKTHPNDFIVGEHP